MSQAGLLSIKQIIGVRSSVTNGLAFQDEQTVVYIAGGNIVLYGIDQKVQRVIPCSINAQGKSSSLVYHRFCDLVIFSIDNNDY